MDPLVYSGLDRNPSEAGDGQDESCMGLLRPKRNKTKRRRSVTREQSKKHVTCPNVKECSLLEHERTISNQCPSTRLKPTSSLRSEEHPRIRAMI